MEKSLSQQLVQTRQNLRPKSTLHKCCLQKAGGWKSFQLLARLQLVQQMRALWVSFAQHEATCHGWAGECIFTSLWLFVCWLLNVPATCKCISGTDLLRQFYVLPHWDRSCRSNFPSRPVTVYWHWADQSVDPITPGIWQRSHWSANF